MPIIILATGAIPSPSTTLNSFGIVSMLRRSGRSRKVFRIYHKCWEVIDSRLGYLAEILLVGFDSGTKAVTRMVLQLGARQFGPKRYLPRWDSRLTELDGCVSLRARHYRFAVTLQLEDILHGTRGSSAFRSFVGLLLGNLGSLSHISTALSGKEHRRSKGCLVHGAIVHNA